MKAPAQLQIDIVSDVVCPWCIIGFKQLERAIGIMGERVEVGVRWHPFQLAPYLPPEGQSIADYGRERYGATPEQSAANRTRIQDAGKPLGIAFNYSSESRIYNTRRAHKLLAWAGETGGQTALKLALFSAYFTDQRNICEDNVLLTQPMPPALTGRQPRPRLRILAMTKLSMKNCITGRCRTSREFRPSLSMANMIPGAQDAETFVQILNRVIEKESAAS